MHPSPLSEAEKYCMAFLWVSAELDGMVFYRKNLRYKKMGDVPNRIQSKCKQL